MPLTPSHFISSSLQKDVLEPPSRKAYVCTVVSLPLALTFTGTTGSPVIEPLTPEKAHCNLSILTYTLWVPLSDCVQFGSTYSWWILADTGMSNAIHRAKVRLWACCRIMTRNQAVVAKLFLPCNLISITDISPSEVWDNQ